MSYPDAWGLKYEDVQGLAWLAFKGQGTFGKYKFPVSGNTWQVTNIFEIGGFRAALIKGIDISVLSFSGTDVPQLEDWANNFQQGLYGISPYYAYALYYARTTAANLVVGHSLGGGLASYCAIYGGKRAATINAAPLNTNPVSRVAMMKNGNLVINYVAIGECLDLLDITTSQTKVGKVIYVNSTGFNPITRHYLMYMQGFVPPIKLP